MKNDQCHDNENQQANKNYQLQVIRDTYAMRFFSKIATSTALQASFFSRVYTHLYINGLYINILIHILIYTFNI